MSVTDASPQAATTPDADFPVAFERPGDEALTWVWDDMHMPFALVPLAVDYVRTLAAGFNVRYEVLGGFPQRWQAAIWSGYAYFAVRLDGTEDERAEVLRRWEETCRAQVDTTGAWWRESALPELAQLYARMDSVDPDVLDAAGRAAGWDDAWTAAARGWALHFLAIIGPYQVMEDLADAYERVVPGASPADAPQLIAGYGDELFAVEHDLEALAAHAAQNPAVATALRADDVPSGEALRAVDGGPAFVAELERFLAAHGHLGQTFDDLRLPSWIEEPGLVLAEIAKRIDRPAVPAARRRERLLRDAAALEAQARTALADRPDDLARFERLLVTARDIGPLTEGHNYHIDRRIQSHLRRLVTRVARWLVREGVFDDPDDVFFLTRDEIRDALVAPEDRRATVMARRAEHARQLTIRPPRVVGREPAASEPADRFDGARLESGRDDELRGTGASAGVVRGTARVTRSPDDFERIRPGDIIVCPSSNPSWIPVFAIAGGLVTNTGGVLSHAAVVAREFGLPAVVGTGDATDRIADGRQIEIDGTTGIVRLL
ncbi:MAG TPA: PEP-utilizing enzyme [Candidatus Limnocylindrales bacterium]|nr:PEP-utilizing enzyme [Candidatus Limnocylindrales bacterium]